MNDDGEAWKATDIHAWFGLSYSQYLVLARSALQSMPLEWQAKFIAMIDELEDRFGHLGPNEAYVVSLEGGGEDPLAHYERGRRRLDPQCKLPEFPPYES